MFAAAAGGARASEFRIEPSITVSEEYNDNVFLMPRDEVTDYITRLVPSVRVRYSAALWDWDILYDFEYRYYLRESVQNDITHRLNLVSTTRIIKDFFFLEIKDTYSRVSLLTGQDYTKVSDVVNQTEENELIVHPYFMLHPTGRTEIKTGYRYRNVWYDDPTAIDKIVHSGYLDLTQDATARLKLTATVWHDATKSREADFTQSYFLAGPRYEYQDGSVLWLRAGANKFSRYPGDWNTRPLWDAGFLQQLPPNSIRYETQRTWIDDPLLVLRRQDQYMVTLNRTVQRTVLNASVAYTEYGLAGYSDERVYSITASFSHFLTEKLQGFYNLSIDRNETAPVRAVDTLSIFYLTQVRFNYLASESLTYSIEYQYADGYSPDIYLDNYGNNRIIAEIRRSF